MPDRNKVGDVDTAGKKAFDAEMAKKPAQAAPKAPEPSFAEKAVETVTKPVRRVREVLGELADLLDPDETRESVHGGKTVMDVVDEAVTGAKEDAP